MNYQLLNSYCTPKPFIVVNDNEMIMHWKEKQMHTSSPEVFGPPVWFTLHTGAAHLPENLSPVSLTRIKAFIDGIPDMLVACEVCSEHARGYIEKNKGRINSFKTGSDIFNFYVDFHNDVNKRLNKRLFSYEEARALYKGKTARVLKYN